MSDMIYCPDCHMMTPHAQICHVFQDVCPKCRKGFLTKSMSSFNDQTVKDYYILAESGFIKNAFCSNAMCDYNDKKTDLVSCTKRMRKR